MFHIEEVGGRYAFPTVDFKFLNPGGTAAVLWQFAIEILAAEVDPTPVLEFTFEVGARHWYLHPSTQPDGCGNDLRVFAVNRGWGRASECEVVLDEPCLNLFFSEEERTFVGSIESEETKQVLRLPPRRVPDDEFNALRAEALRAEEAERRRHESLRQGEPVPVGNGDSVVWHRIEVRPDSGVNRIPRLPIYGLQCKWKCKDVKGQHREGQAAARGGERDGALYLTPRGFVNSPAFKIQSCLLFSGMTYCTMIDPLLGTHERVYPISRVIPPGEAERFHIMVGATKSAVLRLRFRFSINEDAAVTSDEFLVHIRNPSGSWLHTKYRDGGSLSRARTEDAEEALRRVRSGKRPSSYPFS